VSVSDSYSGMCVHFSQHLIDWFNIISTDELPGV
jgi:hypothetical protein